jgi:hypothetical protein
MTTPRSPEGLGVRLAAIVEVREQARQILDLDEMALARTYATVTLTDLAQQLREFTENAR